jgi:hypothetical protein
MGGRDSLLRLLGGHGNVGGDEHRLPKEKAMHTCSRDKARDIARRTPEGHTTRPRSSRKDRQSTKSCRWIMGIPTKWLEVCHVYTSVGEGNEGHGDQFQGQV